MSRQSRFDKLEGERDDAATPSSGASLGRFGAEPELGTRAAAEDPNVPVLNAERIQRFDADGADGLGLDRDPLGALAMLECPACATPCGKFERACHACRASLTDDVARAHNLARLAALKLEEAAFAEAARVKHQEENDAASARWLEKQRVTRVQLDPPKVKTWAPWVYAGVMLCLPFAVFGSGHIRVFAWLLMVGLLSTRMTREMWIRLGKPVRRRDQ